MEFEEEVASQLIQYGYPIFHRNLRVFYNGYDIAELDIVSSNFIVEVKSGKFDNCGNGGFKMLVRHDLIPTEFTYFVYCPVESDDDIKELQSWFSNQQVIFINTLEYIRKMIQPVKNIACSSARLLSNILRIHEDEMNNINTIYTPYEVYEQVYTKLRHLQDTHVYDNVDVTFKLNRLETLVRDKKVVFDITSLNSIFPLKVGTGSDRSRIYMKSLTKIEINLSYYVKRFKMCNQYTKFFKQNSTSQ